MEKEEVGLETPAEPSEGTTPETFTVEPVSPDAETPPESETPPVPEEEEAFSGEKVPRGQILVERDALYRLLYMLVTNRSVPVWGSAGVSRIGQLFGTTSYEESLRRWERIKSYISAHPH